MATFTTNQSNFSSLFDVVTSEDAPDPIDLSPIGDQFNFFGDDTMRSLHENDAQTAFFRTGSFAGGAGSFVGVSGSATGGLDDSNWVVNGLIVSDETTDLYMRSSAGITINPIETDTEFTGIVNRAAVVYSSGDEFAQFEFAGSINVGGGAFTANRLHFFSSVPDGADTMDGAFTFEVTVTGAVTGTITDEGIDNLGGTVTSLAIDVNGSFFSISGISTTALSLFGDTLDTAEEFETLFGTLLSGNDLITGAAGEQLLRGFIGNDTLVAGGNGSVLEGGKGNDVYDFNFWSGVSILNETDTMLGGGIDTLRTHESLTLGDGIENLVGTGFGQELGGNSLNNTITGTGGNDWLGGGTGNDSLIGGLGDDQYELDAALDKVGVEAVDGGYDRVYSSVNHILLANYEELTLQGDGTNINGTGNALENWMSGSNGNNSIAGLGGDDNLFGNDGDDKLAGGVGDDQLQGGNGNDLLDGGDGDDFLEGNEGNNTILGGLGEDLVYAGGTGNDRFDGGGGDDYLDAGAGDDFVLGGTENDELYGGSGNDSMDGGAGHDYMQAGDNDDNVLGGAGNDQINGGFGNDTVDAGAGDDNVDGAEGADQLAGGAGNDEIYGSTEDDNISGGEGNDSLDGGTGTNTLLGGGGNDSITSYSTTDSVDGGTGIDNVVQNGGGDTFSMGAGTENLILVNGVGTLAIGNALANRLESGVGGDILRGGLGNDTYIVQVGDTVQEDSANGGGGTGDLVIFGGGGNDFMLSEGVDNGIHEGSGFVLYGNGGKNVLTSGDGVLNSLNGGLGNDTYNVQGGDGAAEDSAGGGTDHVNATLADGAFFFLGAEIESLTLFHDTEGTITAIGNTGANKITGAATAGANNALFGDDGNDTLIGGIGSDTLHGGDASMSGGEDGIDSLAGGAGDDSYVFSISNLGGALANFAALSVDKILDSGGSDTLTLVGAGEGAVTLTLAALPAGIENVDASATTNLVVSLGGLAAPGLAGNNRLLGGHDTVAGGDTLNGGAGNDTLDGGLGNDSLIGGAGNDWFGLTLFNNEGTVSITNLSEVNDTAGTADVMMFSGGAGVATTFNYTIGADTSSPFEGIDASGADGVIVFNLTGNAGTNHLVGSWGADSIVGLGGNDTLGSGGDDSNGGGLDTLVGGLGNDTYLVRTSATVVEDTGGGFDHVIATLEDGENFSLADNLENLTLLHSGEGIIYGGGNAGNNLITGALGDDVLNSLNGGDGNDTLLGGTGGDSISGGAGNDSVSAGAGNDTITSFEGVDSVNGGLGDDTFVSDFKDTVAGAATGTSLTAATITDAGGTDKLIVTGGEGITTFTFTLGAIDNLSIEEADDFQAKITGSALANSISTAGGNDSVSGAGGNDTIFSGYGNDTVLGGDGNDSLDGGPAGVDSLDGGNGNDTYVANSSDADEGDGSTFVFAQQGDNVVLGMGPNFGLDTIRVSTRVNDQLNTDDDDGVFYLPEFIENLVFTGTGNVEIWGNLGDNSITAGAGHDDLDGGEGGNDTLVGGAGNDWLHGGDGGEGGPTNDSLDGGAGNDDIDGGEGGNDTLVGGLGDDSLYGGLSQEFDGGEGMAPDGDDSLDGGAGKDMLDGGEGGNDTLIGGDGDDTMSGGSYAFMAMPFPDDALLVGPDGNDSMDGGKGHDLMDGGEGGSDTLVGGEGNDSLYGGDDGIEGEFFGMTSSVDDGDDSLSGDLGNDTLDGGEGGNDTLSGGDGIDSLTGGEGNDSMDGGTGNDQVHADSGNDTVIGGTGDDVIWGGSDNDSMDGGAGNDTFDNNVSMVGGNDTMDGGAGNDTYYVDSSSDVVTETLAGAAGGTDRVFADLESMDTFALQDNVEHITLLGTGHSGAIGNGLANVIVGNSGENYLFGGGGNDTVTGGDGTDTFILSGTTAGNVMAIQDFDKLGGDMLGLDGEAFGGPGGILGDGLAAEEVVNGNAATADGVPQLIYKYGAATAVGELYYDADGTGAGAMVLIATFTADSKPLALQSSDFMPPVL